MHDIFIRYSRKHCGKRKKKCQLSAFSLFFPMMFKKKNTSSDSFGKGLRFSLCSWSPAGGVQDLKTGSYWSKSLEPHNISFQRFMIVTATGSSSLPLLIANLTMIMWESSQCLYINIVLCSGTKKPGKHE